MLKGNKGEWSEIYVLLRLLAYGKIYSADDNIKKIEHVYLPILRILREGKNGEKLEYRIASEQLVEIYLNGHKLNSLSRESLEQQSMYLYKRIVEGNSRAFEIEQIEKFIEELRCSKLSASSRDKTDIMMQVHDIYTGFNPVCGFSIKSELGSAPTLLNASGATNFVFEVEGITDNEMEEINALDNPKSKIIDRMKQIFNKGVVKFIGAVNETFANNLMIIDSRMVELMGEVLLCYYRDGLAECKDIIEELEIRNPLEFPQEGFYEFKLKKFLCSVALGMMPSKKWDGYDEANGGYIIVSKEGEVLVYHIYNRNYFEKYLFKSTKLDRGSTSKHRFATLYKERGKMYVNLNLQIRFK